MRDLLTSVAALILLAPKVCKNNTDSAPDTGLDLQGFGSAMLMALIGASGDTLSGTVKMDIVLEESDDNTTFTPVTDVNDVLGLEPDANGIVATIDDGAKDETLVRCGYVGAKRYVRLRAEFTGVHTNGTPISVVGVLGHAANAPATTE